MLRVERIKASYDEVPALHEVSFKWNRADRLHRGANVREIHHPEEHLQRHAPDEGHLLREPENRPDSPHKVVDLGIAMSPKDGVSSPA